MPKKYATEQDWRDLGLALRVLRILSHQVHIKAAKMAPKKDCEHLRQASQSLNAARDILERAMFNRGGPDDKKVFYGPVLELSLADLLSWAREDMGIPEPRDPEAKRVFTS